MLVFAGEIERCSVLADEQPERGITGAFILGGLKQKIILELKRGESPITLDVPKPPVGN
jgi:hypothetical protein